MTRRHWYFSLSFGLSLLAFWFCYLVYAAGRYPDFDIGAHYLSGIPNYYFFYTIVLPFIACGVMYLARENEYIRFFGDLSSDLDEASRRRVYRFRRILLAVALVFSVLITLQDAAEKTTALPPYAIDLGAEDNAEIARFFGCQRGWLDTDCGPIIEADARLGEYLETLRGRNFAGDSVSGFDSFDHWQSQASSLYRFESLLSFVAALVISLLFAEVFLLMMVKDRVRAATKSLVIWLVVLTSIWFPTKMYSSWHSHLGERTTPTVLWFGIVLLVLGILLVIFLKTERNDLYKFASIVTGIFSALVGGISIVSPEMMERAISIAAQAGPVYTSIVALILMFSLYLVTDHFIGNYERESSGKN